MRRLLTVLVVLVTAALAIPAALAVVPVLTTPGNLSAEATSPGGASVSFPVTSSDPAAPPSCAPGSGSVFPLGDTLVSCSATNVDGTVSASFTVHVADTTAPSVSTPGGVTVEATSAAGASATYSASASDAVSGSLTPTCAPASGSAFAIGSTPVTCTATDGAGNTGTGTFSVNVVDTTPPALVVPSDQAATTTAPGGIAVTYPAATATDVVDGAVTPTCSPASGSVFPVGTTTVSCSATDAHGNPGSGSFKVTVTLIDNTPPVVTVPGPQSAEASSGAGAPVSFSASAVDNVDGSLPVSCSPGSGSTFPIGQTNVTCTATDTHGNTGSGSFTVTVGDTTAPSINVPTGDIPAGATSSAGAVVSFSVSASDAVDGAVTPSCSQATGTTFAIGKTVVTCTATDSHGNHSSGSFNVVVSDTTPPTVTVTPPTPMPLEADGASGTAATFAVSAADAVDGGLPASAISCSRASGSTFPLGKTTVTCRATDRAGNTGSSSFDVEVVDRVPPTLNVPAATTVTAGADGTAPKGSGAVAAFLNAAQARDRVDGNLAVTNDAPATFGIGTHTVTFSARDRAGNSATKASNLTVVAAPSAGSGSGGGGSGTAQSNTQPAAPDTTPPGEVSRLVAKSLSHALAFSWALPTDRDFDHVEVEQTIVDAPTTVVYRGGGTSFTVRGLANGFRYRFVVVTYDRVGNASLGAVVTGVPAEQMLVKPVDGSRIRPPATFVWKAVAGTLYYNIQMFRIGSTRSSAQAAEVKVLSAWPLTARFVLEKTWTFQGRRQKLAPGTYRWYIWPGLGARSRGAYGPLLGSSTFVVPR
jgi:hypothetical protein